MRALKILFLLVGLATVQLSAQTTLYWDTDGATPGLPQGNGSWNAAHWSTSASGDVATSGWTNGATATFPGFQSNALSIDSDITVGGIDLSSTHTLDLSGAGVLSFTPGASVQNRSNIVFGVAIGGGATPGQTAFSLDNSYAVYFNGANTFTGKLVVNGGDITATTAQAFGASGTGNETYLTNEGGQFLTFANDMTVNEGFVFGGYRYVGSDTHYVTLAGPIVLDGGGSKGLWSGDHLTISGNIPETNGAGTFVAFATLSGNNTFTGVLQAGKVTIANFNNAGVAGALGMSGGLQLGYDYEGAVSGKVVYTGGTATSDRAISLYGSTSTVEVTNSATTLTLTGAISDAAGGVSNPDFMKTGPGKLVLQGSSTFSGDTLLANGTLSLGSNQALGTGSEVEVGSSGTGSSDHLKLLLQNGVTLNHDVDIYNQNNDGGATALGLDGNTSATFAGEVYLQRSIDVYVPTGGTLSFTDYVSDGSGGGSITKTGAGTAVFSGGMDLRGGGIDITSGTVQLSGAVILADSVQVQSGATLTGNATLTNATTGNTRVEVHSGGTLSPGLPTGTLITSALDMSNGSFLTWKLNSLTTSTLTEFSNVRVDITVPGGGYLEIDSGATVTVDLSLLGISSRPSNADPKLGVAFWRDVQIWDIIAFNGSSEGNDLTPGDLNPMQVANGTWASGKFDTFVGGGAGEFSAFNAGDIYLRFTPVPEPSTYALLGAGLGLLGLRRLRRARG